MSHDIGAMFYVGERPWHGLGKQLLRPATLDEALAAGELDWEVEKIPLRTDEPTPDRVSQRVAIARRDRKPGEPGRVLGVVHRGFVPLQNREGAAIFDRLLALGEQRYHTGGYLRNGEVVWLMARLPDTIVVSDKDALDTYLLYSNSHDGSRAIDIRLTTVRVVCQNTLSLALGRSEIHAPFRRAHRHSPQLLEADSKAFFAEVRERIAVSQQVFRQLQGRPCDDAAFSRFLATLLPDLPALRNAVPNSPTARAWATRRALLMRDRDGIARVRREGVPQAKVPPDAATWWGSVNAVTAWVDHAQEIDGDRYAYALFGSGDRLKAQALDLAIELSRWG